MSGQGQRRCDAQSWVALSANFFGTASDAPSASDKAPSRTVCASGHESNAAHGLVAAGASSASGPDIDCHPTPLCSLAPSRRGHAFDATQGAVAPATPLPTGHWTRAIQGSIAGRHILPDGHDSFASHCRHVVGDVRNDGRTTP